MIDSISLDKIFWGQLTESRLSFSFEGLPVNIHFTISWFNPKRINFHITKNTGDGTNKPKVVIVEWDKELVDAFTPYIPAIVLSKMYKPFSLPKYSRRNRKNIRIVFFDEVEGLINKHAAAQQFKEVFQEHSSVKRNRLKIQSTAGSAFVPVLKSSGIGKVFVNNLHSIKRNSFCSKQSRAGIIFLGNRKHHFVTHHNQCFILQKKKNIQELLMTFMNSELVKRLIEKVETVLKEIIHADNYQDTLHLNSPVRLLIEEPEQPEKKHG